LVSRPDREGLDAPVQPRADNLEEETLDDLSGFVINDLEINGPAALAGFSGRRLTGRDSQRWTFPAFETGGLNHPATHPSRNIKHLTFQAHRTKPELPPDCHRDMPITLRVRI
jgi:hypothetical protein